MWRRKGETMDLRRSRWILGVVLASIAVAGTPAGADESNFTEEQKIDFLQHAKVIASKPGKKGKTDALHLTLSDGRSEERRGGKEGRSRWAPDHLKKKNRR